jgi:hypothetical protein
MVEGQILVCSPLASCTACPAPAMIPKLTTAKPDHLAEHGQLVAAQQTVQSRLHHRPDFALTAILTHF